MAWCPLRYCPLVCVFTDLKALEDIASYPFEERARGKRNLDEQVDDLFLAMKKFSENGEIRAYAPVRVCLS
jgi:hypothetical protein